MTARFPSTPTFLGFDAPLRFEGDIYDLEIIGEVPKEIDGAFFRVAPDPQYPPMLGDDIFFNGDGHVSSFRVKDGHVDFKCRYVHTDRYKAERAARRSLYGVYRNRYTDDPSVRTLSGGTGNTNVVVHSGRLWALKEDSLPIALDPNTLETVGPCDFSGKITSKTFTAHPKIDPFSGEMLCFGYEARGAGTPDIAYYAIDSTGRVTHETWFQAPHSAMIHDMAITENWIVFPLMPYTVDLERLKAGGAHFQWEPTFDIQFGVLPRNGDGGDVRWFRAPNAFPGHTINSFEDGGMIHLDLALAEGNLFPWWPDASGANPAPGQVTGRLSRVTIDPRGRDLKAIASVLSPHFGEFPHSDSRVVGNPYRYAWVAMIDPQYQYDVARGGPVYNPVFNSLGHLDAHTGKMRTYWGGPTAGFQEPVFVPRDGTAPEGEGWVMALVNRHGENRSDLIILDAGNIEAGPVATVRLPVRLKNGLHGNWHNAGEFAPAVSAS
jgi:carotenoid cleavage dioxygenase-like enzyme